MFQRHSTCFNVLDKAWRTIIGDWSLSLDNITHVLFYSMGLESSIRPRFNHPHRLTREESGLPVPGVSIADLGHGS